MTERERLIDILHNWAKKENDGIRADSVTDYLLDNGVIVSPCKVGDKLYVISENRIVGCTCDGINIHNEVEVWVDFRCDYDCKGCPFNTWKQDFHTGEYSCDGEYGDWCFALSDFGKTVFLTKEEAEKALKERENK